VRALDSRIHVLEHSRIAAWVYRLAWNPFDRQVWLVPYLQVAYAPFVVVQKSVCEVRQVAVVLEGRGAADRGLRPVGRVVHTGDDRQVVFVGHVHDVVELLPRRLVPLVIMKVA